jgi:hypothetical protein
MPKRDDDYSRPYFGGSKDLEARSARRAAIEAATAKQNEERAGRFEELSEEYPMTKLGATFIPGVGQMIGMGDIVAEADKGNYGRAALNAVGAIPGGAAGKTLVDRGIAAQRVAGKSIAPAAAQQAALRGERVGEKAVERTDLGNRLYSAAEPFMHSSAHAAPMQVALAEDAGAGYKRGGKVKKAAPRSAAKPVKKATSASRRGDGIAQRGKTKGRMV